MTNTILSPEERKKVIDELIGEVENGSYKRTTAPNHGEKREFDNDSFQEYLKSDFVKSLSEL
jgi:hypothetical protein